MYKIDDGIHFNFSIIIRNKKKHYSKKSKEILKAWHVPYGDIEIKIEEIVKTRNKIVLLEKTISTM